jgi:hypothetical protein
MFLGTPADPEADSGVPTKEQRKIRSEQRRALRWASRERGIDDSIINATRSSRACPMCRYPAPAWRKTCRVCGFVMGRAPGE